jgi:hypothetical protein
LAIESPAFIGTCLLLGRIGDPNQWDYFSELWFPELWPKKLADPCPGKRPLTRFAMAECHAGDGEFSGMETEVSILVARLRNAKHRSAAAKACPFM